MARLGRNLVPQLVLSKRLHAMQIGDNVGDCVPAGKKSESFAEFHARNHLGTNTSSSTALTFMSSIGQRLYMTMGEIRKYRKVSQSGISDRTLERDVL